MYLHRMNYLTMSISSQGEDWFFLPSNDEGDRDTDEDSGDENELLPNNLNRNHQLSAGATVDLNISSGNILLGAGDEE